MLIFRPLACVGALALFVVWGAAGGSASGSGFRETEEFADAVEQTERYADEHGAENTLFVVDIDNTLLAMSNPLGSDQWFEWQSYLLEHDCDSPDLVAHDFSGLLAAQGLLFAVGKMHTPQEDLPELVERVQQLGTPTMVLTSRGDDFRVATERELRANGFDFTQSTLQLSDPPSGLFSPYDPAAPETAGLTEEDALAYRLGEPRQVSYENGVFMAAGQHKGAMLLTMLHRAKQKPKAVVFVDDHGRHVNRVYDALTRHGVEVTVFHYQREDTNVKRFRYGDKSGVAKRWRRLEKALGEVETHGVQQETAEPEAALEAVVN